MSASFVIAAVAWLISVLALLKIAAAVLPRIIIVRLIEATDPCRPDPVSAPRTSAIVHAVRHAAIGAECQSAEVGHGDHWAAGWPPIGGQPVHHTIVRLDVAGSGARDDQLQLRMRADLRAIVGSTLARQFLDRQSVDRHDLGDGIRLIIPADVSPQALIHPFLPNLAAALREHRKAAADVARLRLRVAVHMGLLHRDAGGWAGAPLVHCARLVDAGPLRRALSDAKCADLVVAVSNSVYDEVVRHAYGVDAAAYRRIQIVEKETSGIVWIHVPGYATPPGFHHGLHPAMASSDVADHASRNDEAWSDPWLPCPGHVCGPEVGAFASPRRKINVRQGRKE